MAPYPIPESPGHLYESPTAPTSYHTLLTRTLTETDDHGPTTARWFLKHWFISHQINPIPQSYHENIEKVTWTGENLFDLKAQQMQDDLLSWGFELGHVAGIVRTILQARKVHKKIQIKIFLQQIRQQSLEKIKQLVTLIVSALSILPSHFVFFILSIIFYRLLLLKGFDRLVHPLALEIGVDHFLEALRVVLTAKFEASV